MSLEVQNGKAVAWGIANDGTAISIEGYASFILQDGKLDHKFKLTAIEDEAEFDVSLIATNPHCETTITWQPAGATRADALATISIPVPLKTITIAHWAVPLFNGDWIYVGDASVNLSHTAGKQSLKVRKYDDAAQNASLATTVSG